MEESPQGVGWEGGLQPDRGGERYNVAWPGQGRHHRASGTTLVWWILYYRFFYKTAYQANRV